MNYTIPLGWIHIDCQIKLDWKITKFDTGQNQMTHLAPVVSQDEFTFFNVSYKYK